MSRNGKTAEKKGTGSEPDHENTANSACREVPVPFFSRLETRWLRPAELAAYPLSSTGRKLANLALELDE